LSPVWQLWHPSDGWLAFFALAAFSCFFFVFLCVFLFVVDGFVYRLNQNAVRTQLEPQRQELRALLASLGDETTSQVSGEYPILMGTKLVGSYATAAAAAKSSVLVAKFAALMSLGIGLFVAFCLFIGLALG